MDRGKTVLTALTCLTCLTGLGASTVVGRALVSRTATGLAIRLAPRRVVTGVVLLEAYGFTVARCVVTVGAPEEVVVADGLDGMRGDLRDQEASWPSSVLAGQDSLQRCCRGDAAGRWCAVGASFDRVARCPCEGGQHEAPLLTP